MQRHLLHIVVLLLVLCGCVSRSRYEAMRSGLDSINERNRSDQPFTASDVQPYVDFFDSHGEPNDRLLAYYLLGRAYHEQGEAPMALECYQKAIECADTISEDCDYGQLCRVYAQMGEISYDQFLYRQHYCYYGQSKYYALKGCDTLAAILSYEQQGLSYKEMNMADSAIIVSERVAQLYREHGYHQNAAILLGSMVYTLIEKGEYERAREYISIYERESGLFDSAGNIEKGRETFYYFKGQLHLKELRLDSAEYWFRKELHDGKDFDNQNGGSLGLAKVFELRHMADSAAKYFHYAYLMNDSAYLQMTTSEIVKMQSMYDYSVQREKAVKEEKRSALLTKTVVVCLALLVIMVCVGVLLYVRAKNKRQRIEAKYFQSLEIIKQARHDIEKLQANLSGNTELIIEKERVISEHQDLLRVISKEPLIYKQFVIKGRTPTNEEWDNIEKQVFGLLPHFYQFMESHQHLLNDKEYKTCILIRAGFKPKNISGLLGVTPAYVSKIRTEMLNTLFDIRGTSKDFDKRICSIN